MPRRSLRSKGLSTVNDKAKGTKKSVSEVSNTHTDATRAPAAVPKQIKKSSGLSLSREEALWSQGHEIVVGVDEAGRGPLAGPVVACACSLRKGGASIPGIWDSKQVKQERRDELFAAITTSPDIVYGIGTVDAGEIDKVNILQATLRAMEQAVAVLAAKCEGAHLDAVLVDGRQVPPGISARHTESIIRGDSICFSIAAASIIAKVTRDRLMEDADKRWPEYNFKQHKGYGTKGHMAAIHMHGPCPIHRMTFQPLPKYADCMARCSDDENVPAVGNQDA